jgi:hypothetical protein
MGQSRMDNRDTGNILHKKGNWWDNQEWIIEIQATSDTRKKTDGTIKNG